MNSRPAAPAPEPRPDTWLRNLTMITVLLGWGAVVGTGLAQGKLPDAPLLGVPGATYLALSPSLIGRRKKPAAKTGEDEDR